MNLIFIGILFKLEVSLAVRPWESAAASWSDWQQTHEGLFNTTREHKSQIKALFVGDGIIKGWVLDPKEWGLDVWNKYYAPRNAYNYGISGDTTSNLIWRIENGEFDGLNPKVVVVMIGTSNIGGDPDDDIVHGIKVIIDGLETKMPNSKIILMGLLPLQGFFLDTFVQNVNAGIAKLNSDKVNYLDMGSHFRTSLGKLNPNLYQKGTLHINKAGYTLWHELIEKMFSQFLNDQSVSQNHPWIGQSRDADWMRRHEALVNQTLAHKSDIKIIFFGDSITEGWTGNGREIWAKYYNSRHAYNYGIGGDRTENLIYRIEHKEFDGVMAKVVVLKIGTDNLGSNTEEDIVQGIKEIISQLLIKMPSTKVLLLGIIPRNGETLEKKVEAINTLISKYADNKEVFYLDMSPNFQDSPGKQKAGLYTDTVHLTKEGYQVWYETMEPLLKKLGPYSEPEVITHPWIGQSKDSDWIRYHQHLVNQTIVYKSDIKIVFLGDFITAGWNGMGKEIWAKYYAPRHAYNYGIGGDRTENVIYRIEHKEFDGLMAKVVVLKIGTDNLGANTEEDIAHGIKEIINKLLVKMPSTKILLLGILPRYGETTEKKVQAINTLISKYSDEKKVFYLDMSPQFQDSRGKEKAGLYYDTIHLTKEGYQVWYETMEPLLKKLITDM